MRPALPPGAGAPVVRALYYQALDGAVVALAGTTGITRTLLAPPPVLHRLLDVSPGGQQMAYLCTNRPLTATIWSAPLTETLYLAGTYLLGAARVVPFPRSALEPDTADFLDDDTLLGRTNPPQHDGSDLYLYDATRSTTRLLVARILRPFIFRDREVLLYSQTLTATGRPNPNLSRAPKASGRETGAGPARPSRWRPGRSITGARERKPGPTPPTRPSSIAGCWLTRRSDGARATRRSGPRSARGWQGPRAHQESPAGRSRH